MRRFCSTSCSTARPAPAGSRWRGRARCARVSSAFSRQPSDAGEARLAQADLDGSSHPAGGRGLRRQHRLHARRCPRRRSTARRRCGDGAAQAGAGRVLFGGPDLDLRGLPRRRRALRATQRAAKAPAGGSGRRDLLLPGSRRPDDAGPSATNDQPSELVLNQNGRDLRAARIAELSWTGRRGPTMRAGSTPMSARMRWRRTACSSVTRDGDRLYVQETGRPRFEVAARGVDAFAGNHWRSRHFPARRPDQGRRRSCCRSRTVGRTAGAADHRPPGRS